MRTISYKLDDLKKVVIPIGYEGENDHTRVIIDAGEVFKQYPAAAVTLKVKPPHGTIYPVVVSREGDTVIWDVKETDCASNGTGEAQFTFTENSVIVKSMVTKININRSLVATGPAPDPIEDWLDEATEVLEDLGAMDNIAKNAQASDIGKSLSPKTVVDGVVTEWQYVEQSGGTEDYTDLENKPSIGGVTLSGDKSLTDLGIASASTVSDLAEDVSDVKSAIQGKAPVIVDNTSKNENHDDLVNAVSIDFYGNSNAFSNGRYINSKNYLPNANTTWESSGVTMVSDGHFVTFNGVPTERTVKLVIDKVPLDKPIPAGNYKFRIELQRKMTSYTGFMLYLGYESDPDTRVTAVSKYIGDTDTVYEYEFTATEKVVKMGFSVGTAPNDSYTDYKMWFGVFDALAEVVDTEMQVGSTEVVTYNNPVISSIENISTMHHESVVNFYANTKNYVDEHIPDIAGYWNNNIYALPEAFGAVGDGVSDDTQAMMDCIAYSASSGKPVRGYGKYKTISTLLINTRDQDVYIRYLLYTGNNAAIQLSESNITFGFDVIESSGIGILFQRYSNQSCNMHTVTGNSIKSNGDCIKASAITYYNTVNVRHLKSTNGNCITFEYMTPGTDQPSEYVFRDCTCECNNGWVGYKLWGSKCYNFTIEANCHNGFLDPINCSFFGCRHREFVDAVVRRIFDGDAGKTNGPLFKFTMSPSFLGTHGMKYITADSIPWHSIDVSDIQGYDEITYQSKDDADEWLKYAYNGQDVGVAIRNINKHICEIIGEKLFFIGNNKVYVPNGRTKIILNKAEYDMTLFEGQTDSDIQDAHDQGGWGTDFVTGYSHTDYYMNASFGAIGYNDLTITQQNGNTCTFYDKHGNVLFDGTNEGNGKWSLKCTIDRESTGRLKNAPIFMPEDWWCYDGTNEIWEIVKIE